MHSNAVTKTEPNGRKRNRAMYSKCNICWCGWCWRWLSRIKRSLCSFCAKHQQPLQCVRWEERMEKTNHLFASARAWAVVSHHLCERLTIMQYIAHKLSVSFKLRGRYWLPSLLLLRCCCCCCCFFCCPFVWYNFVYIYTALLFPCSTLLSSPRNCKHKYTHAHSLTPKLTSSSYWLTMLKSWNCTKYFEGKTSMVFHSFVRHLNFRLLFTKYRPHLKFHCCWWNIEHFSSNEKRQTAKYRKHTFSSAKITLSEFCSSFSTFFM